MSEDLIRRSDAIEAINSVGWLEDAEYEEKILAIPTIEPKQCEKIIKAIDTIDDFLIKHSEFWNDITWRSNIDGHELYVDWGYFEEGMREIKNYCKQLRARRASDDIYRKRTRSVPSRNQPVASVKEVGTALAV